MYIFRINERALKRTKAQNHGHEQHEIYMANTNQTLAYPMQTIFHWLALGLTLSLPGFMSSLSGFAFGPPGFLDTHMLVSARVGDLEQCVWCLDQCEAPTQRLSLYSTATQNHSRWVLALAWTPNATILHYLYQHVGI